MRQVAQGGNATGSIADAFPRSGIVQRPAAAVAAAEMSFTFGGPLGDIAAVHGVEPFHLPGSDLMVTTSMDNALGKLADGLSVEFHSRVRRLDLDSRHRSWDVIVGRERIQAAAVILAVPLGVLQRRIEVRPGLPRRVMSAVRNIAPGSVTKVFASFDRRWWTPGGHWYLVEEDGSLPAVPIWVDVSELAGQPVLCGFTIGRNALRLEKMDPSATGQVLGSLFGRYKHAFIGEPRDRAQEELLEKIAAGNLTASA
jgi:hypothetical protein